MLPRRFFSSLLSCSLLACSMSTSPPASPGLYGPARQAYAPQPAAAVAPPPSNVATETPVASGALRIDGGSTTCSEIVSVAPDGGASLLCDLARESACVVRRIAANGLLIGDSDRVPGGCMKAAARADGGVYVATVTNEYRTINVVRLDANGRRVAKSAFTSGEFMTIGHLRTADDGALIASLKFSKDVAFRGKRFGKTKFSTSAIAKLPPKLDRLVWANVLDTRTTWISALLPATRDGVDALINTKGPLVEGAPVNPEPDPATGMFGGNTYGWKAERVAFDRKGSPAVRTEVAKPKDLVTSAAQIGDTLAVLVPDQEKPMRTDLTLLRDGGEPSHTPLGYVATDKLSDASGAPWFIECGDCKYDEKVRRLVGNWRARDTAGHAFTLAVPDAMKVQWSAIAARDDHAVLLGRGIDPATRTPITVTALAVLDARSGQLDISRLQPANHLKLAPGCTAVQPFNAMLAPDKLGELDTALASCGVAANSRVSLTTYADGGLHTFSLASPAAPKSRKARKTNLVSFENAPAKVTSCARRVFEPVLACPLENNNVSFSVRLVKQAR
jgi:hypothetical protein